eukprot:g4202.t1
MGVGGGLYGYYYVCFARTKTPDLRAVSLSTGLHNNTGYAYSTYGPQSRLPLVQRNGERRGTTTSSHLHADGTQQQELHDDAVEDHMLFDGEFYGGHFVTGFPRALNPALIFTKRYAGRDAIYYLSDPIYPGHATLDGKLTWHSIPDFACSGIRVFVFPAHSWEYNFRGPRPVALLENARDHVRPSRGFVLDKTLYPNDPSATFLVLRSNSPDAVEFYLANSTRAEEDFEPLSPYRQTSNCGVPGEIVESTRANFSSVQSFDEQATAGYPYPEYKLYAYMNTRDLKPRRFYTLCTRGFGALSLLKVWTTDLYATPSHLSPYPTTSLVTNLFTLRPEAVFSRGNIYLGDENCKVENFYLKAEGQFSIVEQLDFGKNPPTRAQVLLTKYVNYDVQQNPLQTVRFHCPNARASGCVEGKTFLYLANVTNYTVPLGDRQFTGNCEERVTEPVPVALDRSEMQFGNVTEFVNFTALVDVTALTPMQRYSVCIDYDGATTTFASAGASKTTDYAPVFLDILFVNPVRRFVPKGFVHFGTPSTFNLQGFPLYPEAHPNYFTTTAGGGAATVTDSLDVNAVFAEQTILGASLAQRDVVLFFAMEKTCDDPEGPFYEINPVAKAVTVIPRGAHLCMRAVEKEKGASGRILRTFTGDTRLKVEDILATHPEVFLTKFQICEMPIWNPTLVALLATGRDIPLYGGSLGVEAILSGFQGGSVTGFQSPRLGPFLCFTHCADVESTTRRFYLSSFATVSQQLQLDNEKERIDPNCFLSGMWCPTACETKVGLTDAEGFALRSPLVTSEYGSGDEFWLNLPDKDSVRPGKHYTLCNFFSARETRAATNPRFMTPLATRRVDALPYVQGPYADATLPVSNEVASLNHFGEFGDTGIREYKYSEVVTTAGANGTTTNTTQVTTARIRNDSMNYTVGPLNDNFTQVVPAGYQVYISPVIQTEYRIIKPLPNQQVRVFCPTTHNSLICFNNTAQWFLADHRDCLERNRRTSYSTWVEVAADPNYSTKVGHAEGIRSTISEHSANLDEVHSDEQTLTNGRHYVFHEQPSYLDQNRTFVVSFDASRLLSDYYYYLCVDIDGIDSRAWNSSFSGWSGVLTYVTPVHQLQDNVVNRNASEQITLVAEPGLTTGWLDAVVPPDANFTYGPERSVVTRQCVNPIDERNFTVQRASIDQDGLRFGSLEGFRRPMVEYALEVNSTALTEGVHYVLCARRNKSHDGRLYAEYLQNWTQFAVFDAANGSDTLYSGASTGTPAEQASPIYDAVVDLTAVEHKSLYSLPGHAGTRVESHAVVQTLQQNSWYGEGSSAVDRGGSSDQRVFVSGFYEFHNTSMIIGFSNYSVSCSACELVGRYAYINSDAETRVHLAPTAQQCGERPWNYWTYSVNAPPFCIEVSPFPDLVIECFPDAARKQIWTPNFLDFIKYGAFYQICLKHQHAQWGPAGVPDVYTSPATADVDVVLVRGRRDFFVTLTCYYVCHIVDPSRNFTTFDSAESTAEVGNITYNRYYRFATWEDLTAAYNVSAGETSIEVQRYCTSECDHGAGFLRPVELRTCERSATHGVPVIPLANDNFNRTITQLLLKSETPAHWNEPVMLERKMKLLVETENYAPRAYYAVCLDTGFGYGPVPTSAQIFVRDQGILQFHTVGFYGRGARCFVLGNAEYIWFDCDGCVPGVTRAFLQEYDINDKCYPNLYEYRSASGKDEGNADPTVRSDSLWLLDSRSLTPNRYYYMCLDLDGAQSDIMQYEFVDATFLGSKIHALFYSVMAMQYDPRAAHALKGQHIYVDVPGNAAKNGLFTPLMPYWSPVNKVYWMLELDRCKQDVNVVDLNDASMSGPRWGYSASGEDDWKHSKVLELFATNNLPKVGEYGRIPSPRTDSDMLVWYGQTDLDMLRAGYYYRVCGTAQQVLGMGDSNLKLYISPVLDFYTESAENERRQLVDFQCSDCYENETLAFMDYNCSAALQPFLRVAEVSERVAALSPTLQAQWQSLLTKNLHENSYHVATNLYSEHQYPDPAFHGVHAPAVSPVVDFLASHLYPNLHAHVKRMIHLVYDAIGDAPSFLIPYGNFSAAVGVSEQPAALEPPGEFRAIVGDAETARQGEYYKKQLDGSLPVHTNLEACCGFRYQVVYHGQSLLQRPTYPTLTDAENKTWRLSVDFSYSEKGRHYELCVRRNATLATGPSSHYLYVNPIPKRKDITIKMLNLEPARLHCPVCDKFKNNPNVYQSRLFISAEPKCDPGGKVTEVQYLHTSAQLITIDDTVPGFNAQTRQNAKVMRGGQTYKMCVDVDGPGTLPPHTNHWHLPTMRYGYAEPHSLFVSPILQAQRTIYDLGLQHVDMHCPDLGCVAGMSVVFFEKFEPGKDLLLICKNQGLDRRSDPLIQEDVAKLVNIPNTFRVTVDAGGQLEPGWYRICYDYDGVGGALNLMPGWSEHDIYNSGVYNAYSQGLQKRTDMAVFVNCNGCSEATTLAFMSRDCEQTYTVQGANYSQPFKVEKILQVGFPYGWRMTGDTSGLQYAWSYRMCLSVSGNLTQEPIGTSLKFYVSPLENINQMTVLPLEFLQFRFTCYSCDESMIAYISYQCDTQEGLNPVYRPGGYFDLYTPQTNFLKRDKVRAEQATEFDWALEIDASNPLPGLRPGRHYSMCVINNGELGNAVPNIYTAPILKKPVWNWRPSNFSTSSFTPDIADNVWIYDEPEPLYIHPGGMTVCAWFQMTPFNEQTKTKAGFPVNPIIDGERYGLNIMANSMQANFFVRDELSEGYKDGVKCGVTAGVHHLCGVWQASRESIGSGRFLYFTGMKLFLDGRQCAEKPYRETGMMEKEWDYLYTMIGSERRYMTEFEGSIWDARLYDEPYHDRLIEQIYEEGYAYPPLSQSMYRSNTTDVHFFCYVPCIGSKVVLSTDCDDLEDPSKRGEFGSVTTQRYGQMDILPTTPGRSYDLCWRIQDPPINFSPYTPKYGNTGVKVFIRPLVHFVNVTGIDVSSATVEVIQEATSLFACQPLLTGREAESNFILIPTWIRNRGSQAAAWRSVSAQEAFEQYGVSSDVPLYRGLVPLSKLTPDLSYTVYCAAQQNEDELWVRTFKTKVPTILGAKLRLHEIQQGSLRSPYHRKGPGGSWVLWWRLSDFLYPEVGPENGTAAGCGYSNLTYCPDYCSVGIDGLHPASDYDFECWSLSVPSERVNGTGRTATPPLACGGFLCVALDSTGAVLTEWNVTATRFLPVPSGMPMRTVDTNGRTSCGVIAADVRVDVVMTNHHVECASLFDDRTQPFFSVALGEFHKCGVKRGLISTLECAGEDRWGQLVTLRGAELTTNYLEVSCGWTHCCALSASFELKCWGYLPSEADRRVQCWGSNEFGQAIPTNQTVASAAFDRVACGVHHTCGIMSGSRKIACWGAYTLGQLELGPEVESDEFINVAVGFYHACALNLYGAAKCWGPGMREDFVIQNFTHQAILREDPDRIFNYTISESMNENYIFYIPREKKALNYKSLNFLPLTSKFGFVSAGSGASGIPNNFTVTEPTYLTTR